MTDPSFLPQFIRDEPAIQDRFGSHARVAKAIASVVRQRSELKVIGIIGPWGSGKSTVVRLVTDLLASENGEKTIECFAFDAWLHQNDPPRRSFLEALVSFLISKKLLKTPDVWVDKIAELQGKTDTTETSTTPVFTARLTFLSLLLIPVGITLLGHDWIKDALAKPPVPFALTGVWIGIVLIAQAIPALLIHYWSWRPRRWPLAWRWPPFAPGFFTRDNFRRNRAPHEDDSIFALLTNKHTEKTKSSTQRAAEPSVIEFQSVFWAIMTDAASSGSRIVFVIDNLDRIMERESLAFWSTIRSFFLDDRDSDRVANAPLPTVLLPVDPNALEQIYRATHGDDAKSLVKAFSEKTFDLAFRVAPPVLSDWKDYFSQQMRSAFQQQITEDDLYHAGMFYELVLRSPYASSVTPRTVNATVNRMATLWLQWHDAIPFAAIAYYAIVINGDEEILATGEPLAGIANVEPEWQKLVAAIHFGVSPDKAIQVLIERRLRMALDTQDKQEFSALSKFSGFDQVLTRVLLQASSGDAPDVATALKSAALMATIALNDPERQKYAWLYIRTAFEKPTPFQGFQHDDAAGFLALLAHSPQDLQQRLLAVCASKIAATSGIAAGGLTFGRAFVGFWSAVKDFADANRLQLPTMTVPGAGAVYLSVLRDSIPDLRLLFHSDAPDAEIAQELVAILKDEGDSPPFDDIVGALARVRPGFSWDTLLASATRLVETLGPSSAALLRALSLFGLLIGSDTSVRKRILTLIENGAMGTRLQEALSAKEADVQARLIAIILLSGVGMSAPDGQEWQQLIRGRAPWIGKLNRDLLKFGAKDNFDELVSYSKTNPTMRSLVQAIVSLRLKEQNLGAFDPKKAIGNLSVYQACIETGLRDMFIDNLAAQPGFWEALEQSPLNDFSRQILRTLIKNGSSNKAQLDYVLRLKLAEISTAQWRSALQSAAPPFDLLASMLAKSTFDIGSGLIDALSESSAPMLASTNKALRDRWFVAVQFVSGGVRAQLMRELRDLIVRGGPVADLLALLDKSDALLLHEGAFDEVPDGTVQHLILPLLQNSATALDLLSLGPLLKTSVANCSATIRNQLRERLHVLWLHVPLADKTIFETLCEQWKLPPL